MGLIGSGSVHMVGRLAPVSHSVTRAPPPPAASQL
jgi:hypothetical protein